MFRRVDLPARIPGRLLLHSMPGRYEAIGDEKGTGYFSIDRHTKILLEAHRCREFLKSRDGAWASKNRNEN